MEASVEVRRMRRLRGAKRFMWALRCAAPCWGHCFMQEIMGHASVILNTARLRFTFTKAFFNTSPHTKKYICFNRPPYVVHFQYGIHQYSSTTPGTGPSQKPSPHPPAAGCRLPFTAPAGRIRKGKMVLFFQQNGSYCFPEHPEGLLVPCW